MRNMVGWGQLNDGLQPAWILNFTVYTIGLFPRLFPRFAHATSGFSASCAGLFRLCTPASLLVTFSKMGESICLCFPGRLRFNYPYAARLPACSRKAPFKAFTISLSTNQCPPVQALRATIALPSGLFGPVDWFHGFHRLMASLCRLRRSGVHPFACLLIVCAQ